VVAEAAAAGAVAAAAAAAVVAVVATAAAAAAAAAASRRRCGTGTRRTEAAPVALLPLRYALPPPRPPPPQWPSRRGDAPVTPSLAEGDAVRLPRAQRQAEAAAPLPPDTSVRPTP